MFLPEKSMRLLLPGREPIPRPSRFTKPLFRRIRAHNVPAGITDFHAASVFLEVFPWPKPVIRAAVRGRQKPRTYVPSATCNQPAGMEQADILSGVQREGVEAAARLVDYCPASQSHGAQPLLNKGTQNVREENNQNNPDRSNRRTASVPTTVSMGVGYRRRCEAIGKFGVSIHAPARGATRRHCKAMRQFRDATKMVLSPGGAAVYIRTLGTI